MVSSSPPLTRSFDALGATGALFGVSIRGQPHNLSATTQISSSGDKVSGQSARRQKGFNSWWAQGADQREPRCRQPHSHRRDLPS